MVNDPQQNFYPALLWNDEEEARAADGARMSVAEWLRERERETVEGCDKVCCKSRTVFVAEWLRERGRERETVEGCDKVCWKSRTEYVAEWLRERGRERERR